MSKKRTYNAGIVAIAGLLLLSSCGPNKGTNNKKEVTPIKVTTARAETTTTNGIAASGSVESERTAQISTRIMGYITKIHVKIGDPVKQGQVLVTISDQDIRAKKAQAVAATNSSGAALKVAEKDYQRFTTLYSQQSASAKELENITLQYEAAKAKGEAAQQMLNEVNAMLAYTRIVAPFSGTVTRKMADEGSMANPGMPILTVEQNGKLQVSASIPESEIGRATIGDPVQIDIKSVQKRFQGKIEQISRSSQFSGGQYEVKISIPEQETSLLLAGMYVTIFIPLRNQAEPSSKATSVWVPAGSLEKREQLTGLYTIQDDKTVALRWVRTGKTTGDRVEIISGLSENEIFVVKAEEKLYNGAPVTMTN